MNNDKRGPSHKQPKQRKYNIWRPQQHDRATCTDPLCVKCSYSVYGANVVSPERR
jgi:hypothetical protein